MLQLCLPRSWGRQVLGLLCCSLLGPKCPEGTRPKPLKGIRPPVRQELVLKRCLEALALSAAESAARSKPVITAGPLECKKSAELMHSYKADTEKHPRGN